MMYSADWNIFLVCCVFSEIYSRILRMNILKDKNILILFDKIAIVPIPNKQDLRCSRTMELAKLSAHFAICLMWNVCLTSEKKLHNLLDSWLYTSRQYQLLSEVFPTMLTQPFNLAVCWLNGGGIWCGTVEKSWPMESKSLSSWVDQKWKAWDNGSCQ